MTVFNDAVLVLVCIMLCIGMVFTVSTFDTHNWISLVVGALCGTIGIALGCYHMMMKGEQE